jgi:hypothetical protein
MGSLAAGGGAAWPATSGAIAHRRGPLPATPTPRTSPQRTHRNAPCITAPGELAGQVFARHVRLSPGEKITATGRNAAHRPGPDRRGPGQRPSPNGARRTNDTGASECLQDAKVQSRGRNASNNRPFTQCQDGMPKAERPEEDRDKVLHPAMERRKTGSSRRNMGGAVCERRRSECRSR